MIVRTLLFLLLAACTAQETDNDRVRPDASPRRVVSLDYCADQYVLALVERDDIAAVSRDAGAAYSYMREAAAGLPHTNGRAESVLAVKPDLIVRTYGGGPEAATFYQRIGIPVVQIGYAGDLAGIGDVLVAAGEDLGTPAKAETMARDMRARLENLSAKGDGRSALYMTQGGVTAGTGTLIDQLFIAAGYTNFQESPGWHALPLERLATQQPDVIAAAFFKGEYDIASPWSASRHPIARRQLATRPVIELDAAWTACGGWFILEAIEKMAEAPL